MSTNVNVATSDYRNDLDTAASLIEEPSTEADPFLALDGHFPPWIGQKFEPDGTTLPFPGNTIICHLSTRSDLHRQLLMLFDKLQNQRFSSSFVLLPPSSWHMTVFEGVCDRIRNTSSWPGELPLDTTLQTCSAFMEQKLKEFDLGCKPPFRMAIQGWEPLKDGVIALKIVPMNVEEEMRLRCLRDRLAEQLGMRQPDHDIYVFHISLAYILRHLTKEESKAVFAFLEAQLPHLPSTSFELGAPEFCTFDDMFLFHRRFYLDGS